MASLAGKVSGDAAPKLLAGTGSDSATCSWWSTPTRACAAVSTPTSSRRQVAKARELHGRWQEVEFYLVGKKGRAPLKREFPADRRRLRHQHWSDPGLHRSDRSHCQTS
jgi:F-type H+-transporting ATPase subunit gamma